MYYRLYGSYKGGKFKAMDTREGVQVNKLIYATLFMPCELKKLKEYVEELRRVESEWKFEIREVERN